MSQTPTTSEPPVGDPRVGQYDDFGRPITASKKPTNPWNIGTDPNDTSTFLKGLLISHLLSPEQLAKQRSLLPPLPDPSAILGAQITPSKVGAADLVMPVIPHG